MTTPVNPDQLRVSIEMGDDYQPSDRLRAALGELVDALADGEPDAEVSGYLLQFEIQDFKAVTYDSALPTGQQGSVFPKVELRAGVFKF